MFNNVCEKSITVSVVINLQSSNFILWKINSLKHKPSLLKTYCTVCDHECVCEIRKCVNIACDLMVCKAQLKTLCFPLANYT